MWNVDDAAVKWNERGSKTSGSWSGRDLERAKIKQKAHFKVAKRAKVTLTNANFVRNAWEIKEKNPKYSR